MTQLLLHSNNFYFSNGESINYDFTNEDNILESKETKIIHNFVNITLGIAMAFTVFTMETSENVVTQTVEDIRFDQFNIRNESNQNHIENLRQNEANNSSIEWNNEHLEVDGLADKVTQAQVEEIKSHFDTKINSVHEKINEFEKVMDSKFEASDQKTINEISKQIKSLNDEKTNHWRFLISSIIVPICIAILTSWLSNR